MKIIKCVRAMNAICELQEEKLPKHFAHRLYIMKTALMPHVEYYTSCELEILNDCAIRQEDGTYKPIKEKLPEYIARKKELDDLEIDFEKKPLNVVPDFVIGKHLEALHEVFNISEDAFKE